MKVPCYKQEFWFSCFATCVKMILEYLGINKSERDLRVLLKTTPSFGTIWEEAEREIKRIGFEIVWKKFWDIEELNHLINISIPVIVGLKRIGEIHGHAVVVVEISDDHVIVADPQIGDTTNLKKEVFLDIWNGRERIAGYIKKI